MRGHRLCGLRGALDRAGVDHRHRQPGQPFAEGLGLLAPLVGEVDAGGPAREQRAGLRGDGVAGQHQPGRRAQVLGARGSVDGLRTSLTRRSIPHDSTGAPYPRRRDRPADLVLTAGAPRDRARPRAARRPRRASPKPSRSPSLPVATRSPPSSPAGPASSTAGPASASSPATRSRPTPASGSATTAGLDRLRQSGWRGSGYVRWEHPTNRGFLRALDGLRASAAAAIGETDEEARCAEFLHQLEPAWDRIDRRPQTSRHEARADHRHHRPGRPLPRQVPGRARATRSSASSAGRTTPRPRS